jgi:ribosomal protein L35AE/L33A
VLQRQYVDEPSTYVDKYLCYKDNTLMNHQRTWTSICVTETILWRTINLRGQVFVVQRQYVDESSTYVGKYLCYRDNTLMNHQLTWKVFVVQRQYVDESSTYVGKYLCYRDNTLMNHQLTWKSICATKTIRWWIINERGQVFVLQRQYVDEPSTYVDKYLCYRDNTLTNHQLTWTSICVTETILWWTINLRRQVFV